MFSLLGMVVRILGLMWIFGDFIVRVRYDIYEVEEVVGDLNEFN